jgi:hypothetical protein
MIILSFNARGVGGASKIQALERLVADYKPNILLIQETMCLGENAMDSFRAWLRDWSFCAVDSIGSRGLLSSWSPNFKYVSSVISQTRIMVNVEDYTMVSSFQIINIYGP